jgi:hypothetical protein
MSSKIKPPVPQSIGLYNQSIGMGVTASVGRSGVITNVTANNDGTYNVGLGVGLGGVSIDTKN